MTAMLNLSESQIKKDYKIIQQYHKKHLAKHGVVMPKLVSKELYEILRQEFNSHHKK